MVAETIGVMAAAMVVVEDGVAAEEEEDTVVEAVVVSEEVGEVVADGEIHSKTMQALTSLSPQTAYACLAASCTRNNLPEAKTLHVRCARRHCCAIHGRYVLDTRRKNDLIQRKGDGVHHMYDRQILLPCHRGRERKE